MVVIQDEDELSIHLLHLIEERGQDGRERRSLWRMKHLSRRLAKGGQTSLHCGNDREPEADRIIVWLVKGEPGTSRSGTPPLCALLRPPAWEHLMQSCHPRGEQRGLPTSSSGRDQRQGVRERRIQFAEQARAFHKRAWQTRRREPQREQRGALLNLRGSSYPCPCLPRCCSAD